MDKCLKSFENQTFKNFEIIFVDDCSTDGTYDFLLEYQKNNKLNIQVLKNDVNSGPAYSRNRGILLSTSDYVTFCDCDDWYDVTYLSEMVSLIETTASNLVFCGHKVVNSKNHVQFRPITNHNGIISKSEAWGLDADSLCMLMVQSSIIKRIPLPDVRNGEDAATVPLLIAVSDQIAVTSSCLYNYFRRINSASQSVSDKTITSFENAFLYTKKHFPVHLKDELEYIGIRNLLYSTVISIMTIGYNISRIEDILQTFQADFPFWYSNKYFHQIALSKRLVLFLLHHKLYPIIKLVAIVRKIIITI